MPSAALRLLTPPNTRPSSPGWDVPYGGEIFRVLAQRGLMVRGGRLGRREDPAHVDHAPQRAIVRPHPNREPCTLATLLRELGISAAARMARVLGQPQAREIAILQEQRRIPPLVERAL